MYSKLALQCSSLHAFLSVCQCLVFHRISLQQYLYSIVMLGYIHIFLVLTLYKYWCGNVHIFLVLILYKYCTDICMWGQYSGKALQAQSSWLAFSNQPFVSHGNGFNIFNLLLLMIFQLFIFFVFLSNYNLYLYIYWIELNFQSLFCPPQKRLHNLLPLSEDDIPAILDYCALQFIFL